MSLDTLSYSAWRGALSTAGRLALVGVFLLLMMFALQPPARAAENGRIATLEVHAKGDGLYLNAQVELVLSNEMRNALEKGITLYFLYSVELKRERWYWFDAVDAQKERSVRLSFQPLLQQYRVTIGSLGTSFDSLAQALNFAGYVSDWRIADASVLKYSGNKRLIFTVELDRSKLPRPFQLSIEQQEGWQLNLKQQVDLQIAPASAQEAP